ncbi:hypothetical protein Gasu2_13800 [Galdieria sulphuraria]|nr:hypothetical protein Gasu2_13800 [Galdieria sulphuraria]
MVSPDGVNRMLDFSEKRNSYNYHQAEERKPKLFQNLSFDVPLTREATAGQEGSIVSYKRNKREDSGGRSASQTRMVSKLRRFVCF